jgi:hypothetical protein
MAASIPNPGYARIDCDVMNLVPDPVVLDRAGTDAPQQTVGAVSVDRC